MPCPSFIFYTLNSNLSYSNSIIFQIPPGVWEIFNNREICCGVHAPFSSTCKTKGPNNPNRPTLEPTIALPSAPDTDEVALKFDLNGLPDDMNLIKLKANVLEALKIILAQLKERVPNLRVTEVSESSCNERRRLDQQLRQLRMEERKLRSASICYTVEVMNNDNGRDNEKLIVSEARESSDLILDRIRTKLNYVNVGMGIGNENGNGSGSANGGSNAGNTATMSNTNEGGGLPSWGIALIVIVLLIVFCCIGYCIYVSVRNNKDERYTTDVLFNNPVPVHQSQFKPVPPHHQPSFAHRGSQALRQSFARRRHRSAGVRDRPRRRDDGRRRRSTGNVNRYGSLRSSFSVMSSRVHRPRRSRGDRPKKDNDVPAISLSNPEDPRFSADEFTVNTYTTNKKSVQEPPMNAMVLYEPNYEKPDPEGETAGNVILALTNGEDNTRSEEPDAKPKLEPEEVLLIESAPLDRPRRSGRNSSRTSSPDPEEHFDGVFIEPQQVLYGANNDDDNGDEYVFRPSQPQMYAPQRTSKKEELDESFSFATEDPEEAERRRAKKSRKKKKKKEMKRGSSSSSRRRYEESRRRSSSTPESFERERAKAHRNYSGVESFASVGSIELESKASA